jgi:hypothetical protein
VTEVREGTTLWVVEEEAATVRRIPRMRNQAHLSYHETARRLNREAVPTKQGGRWHAEMMRTAVLNPMCRGASRYAGLVMEGEQDRIA